MANEQIVGVAVPGNPAAQRIIYWIGRRLIRLLLRVTISGQDNVPASGPVVVAINHIAFLDPVIVMGELERDAVPLAKIESFSLPIFGLILKLGGAIPVHRGEADTTAIKSALRVLKAGGMVLLAPEGTRSPSYQLQPAKDGAVILALRSQAPLVPVSITGTERVQANWRRLRRPPITITVGAPIYLKPAAKRATREEIAAMTRQLMAQVAAQLPPAYRGVYGSLVPPPEK